MAASVRTHTRRQHGRAVTVHHHTRATHGRAQRGPLFQPRRAGRNLKRAWRAARRHKKTVALGFCLLSLGEIGAWTAGRGIGATFTVLALVFAGIGAAALGSTRSTHHEAADRGRRAPSPRRGRPVAQPTVVPPRASGISWLPAAALSQTARRKRERPLWGWFEVR